MENISSFLLPSLISVIVLLLVILAAIFKSLKDRKKESEKQSEIFNNILNSNLSVLKFLEKYDLEFNTFLKNTNNSIENFNGNVERVNIEIGKKLTASFELYKDHISNIYKSNNEFLTNTKKDFYDKLDGFENRTTNSTKEFGGKIEEFLQKSDKFNIELREIILNGLKNIDSTLKETIDITGE
jgi:hypothetical protein